jgi:hypothetical protein
MPSETEVIACPACRHALRVPTDWLGQPVQCPECQAKFRAPVRDGDRLTDPVLIAGPPAAAPAPPARRSGSLLTFPAFGLMLVGAAAMIANGVLFVRFVTGPDGGREWLKNQLPAIRQAGFGRAGPDADPAEQDERAAAEIAPRLFWVWPLATAAGALTFAGGLAMLRRKGYRLAQVGCVAAAVNAPHLCCVPGALFGFWGLVMLMSDEGREAFGGVARVGG